MHHTPDYAVVNAASMRRAIACAALLLGAWLLVGSTASADPPFAVGGDPSVDPSDFRVTTFATGLDFPYTMTTLPDNSIVVGTGSSPDYANSSGQLIRLSDPTDSGTATTSDVLYSGLPGAVSQVSRYGNLYVVTSNSLSAHPVTTFLEAGPTPSSPLTKVGSVNFNFPNDATTGAAWDHTTYAGAVRPAPGDPSSFQFFFNVGSQYNGAQDTGNPTVTGLVNATLQGSSIYMVTVHDTGGTPTLSGLTEVASGLRNAAGIAVQPGTGNLWFVDNGIDGPNNNPYAAVSTDTLHTIAAAQIGQSIPFFGFPNNYIAYYTGQFVGGAGVPPVVAFQPIPDTTSGSRAQGATQLAFTPANFPAALQDGAFVGFHGKFMDAGVTNDENPVIYANLNSGHYFDFLSNDLPLGHPNALLSTHNALFVADMSTNGSLTSTGLGQGVIYQIEYVPEPASYILASLGLAALWLTRRRGSSRRSVS